jgi:hypothetical protein
MGPDVELTTAFFERDLSADEADRLGRLLQEDPAAAEAMLAQAQQHYRACGLPEPSWDGRPRRGLPRGLYWGAALLMAAGLGAAFFSDDRTPTLPVAVWASGAPDREVALPAPKPALARAAREAGAPEAPPPASRRGHQLRVLLHLAGGGPVRVSVLDDTGHLKRELFQGYLSAGEHALPWNGQDDAGQPVAAGKYRVLVASGGHTMEQTLKVGR